MIQAALAVGLLSLLAGLALLWQARRARFRSGLPAGEVVYSDTSDWAQCERPLRSRKYRLTGRPDYVVRRGGTLTPVEVKSTRGLAQPHDSHVLQLMAYCLLLEEQEGRRPAYGLLRYPDRTFQIPYTSSARAYLLEVVSRLRSDLRRGRRPAQPFRSAPLPLLWSAFQLLAKSVDISAKIDYNQACSPHDPHIWPAGNDGCAEEWRAGSGATRETRR